ncbi:uncharacterized protein LOC114528495 [Dendronephthya gigantea]|uniref:uncharacterized protein LOC114528495 n=1 Tax=Dendronephthya gigantea TaxID=151771 RepID=UPI00106D4B0D|nr:uncharacterized protein LOC114528495 [Dendronephthya gigantea]
MNRFISWLFFIATLASGLKAQEELGNSLSAVIEEDQIISYDSVVKNWVHSGRPGLFMTGFDKMDNTSFLINEAGVYYISANLIVKATRYSWYSNRISLNGKTYLTNKQGNSFYNNRQIKTFLVMNSGEKKNLRISGYIQLEKGWRVAIQISSGYSRNTKVMIGSTLSILHVSSASLFPGMMLKNNYEYLHLRNPSYSADIVDWNEIDEGSAFPESEGSFMIPRSGLYHILANINFGRYSSIQLKFAVVINNKTEAITRTVQIKQYGTHTITLDGVLNLIENQTVTLGVTSSWRHTHVYINSASRFFIFSKGATSESTPALSTSYKSTASLPADKYSTLNKWNIPQTHNLNHYISGVQLKNGEFVAPKQGVYQIIMAIYISNCTSAKAQLSMNSSSSNYFRATGPELFLAKENDDCYLQNSLLLKMDKYESLRLSVKSDQVFKVLSKTTYQVVLEKKYNLWPSTTLSLVNTFTFNTNSAMTKVHDWSHKNEGDWNDVFFDVKKENIKIKSYGLYLVSYNLIVQPVSAGGQFSSQLTKNGTVADGSECKRGSAPKYFTCTVSTMLELNEGDKLAVQVSMTDKSGKKKVNVLTSSKMTVTMLGDTRSHPAFKLNVKPATNTYVTKATDIKQLNDFTTSINGFFQSAAIYSNHENTFHTGTNNVFFLLDNLQFDLQNDGYLSAVVGSEKTKMVAYSKDHKKSKFSVTASDISVDSQFYFNVSAKASKSDMNWKPESGSVVSGVFTGTSTTVTYVRAQLRPKGKFQCNTQWRGIGLHDWINPKFLNNPATITKSGMKISKSGFYLTSLNFAVTSNKSDAIVNVGILRNQDIILSAKETSPSDGRFSVFLQGVLDLRNGQDIEVHVKCADSIELTYAEDGGIFAYKVDELQTGPQIRRRFSANSMYNQEVGTFYPYNWYNDPDTFEEFTQGISYDDWKISVSRSGVYLVSVVGFVKDSTWSWWDRYKTDDFELGFTSPANKSKNALCSLDSSPLYFRGTSDDLDKPLALTGFVLLDKHNISGFLGRYNSLGLNYNSRLYMSIQFMGDIASSSGFAATLPKDTALNAGKKQKLKDKSWTSEKKCGKYTTKDVPENFGSYGVLYTGFYIVAVNLVIDHEDNCDFEFCFTVDGKTLKDGGEVNGLNVGCFKQRLVNQSNITTVSGAEILHLEAGKKLSIEVNTNLGVTILKRSSFSAFYIGTAGAIIGASSAITAKEAPKRQLPDRSSRHGFYHHYYDDDDVDRFEVQGWKTNIPNTKMFFKRGMKYPLDSVFVSPKNGVYMVLVKLRVEGEGKWNETCEITLKLAVDGKTLDFAFEKDFHGKVNTLSFTTTLRLEKWQSVSVRFTRSRIECKNMEIVAGSTFAVVYLDSGKKAFTLWPNIGPHIIEFPSEYAIYVREDKDESAILTCKAVGKYPVKYEWKDYNGIVKSTTSKLDSRTLGNSTQVQCVVTMRELVEETQFVHVRTIDPTVIFNDDYSNRTYFLPEKNETHNSGYIEALVFGATIKKYGYYRWYWYWWFTRIYCFVSDGNLNNTFSVTHDYGYYGAGDYYKLKANLSKLDRETTPKYDLKITCRNIEYLDAKPATTTIHVEILDANDNLPVFDKDIYKIKVPNTLKPGIDIIQVRATDDDAEENGKITYTLAYTQQSYIFHIVKDLGVISLKKDEKLTESEYRLSVKATDQGKPPRFTFVTVVIEVDFTSGGGKNDTNKNPIFFRKAYEGTVIKGSPSGTFILTVQAYDPDGRDRKKIRYFIKSSSDDGVFKIDTQKGRISTAGELTKFEYKLEIVAKYEGDDQQKDDDDNTASVTIEVKTREKNKLYFKETKYDVRIPENAKVNSKVVKVEAFSDPNVSLVYSIIGNLVNFKINKDNGQITLARKLDYETQKAYTFAVRVAYASKSGGSTETTVNVNVTDVNDHRPVFKHYERNITVDVGKVKGKQEIGYYYAHDDDQGQNGIVKYYLKEDYGVFSITPDGGILKVIGHLDCCDVVYLLTVVAKDQGIPALTAEVKTEIFPKHGPALHTTPRVNTTHGAHSGHRTGDASDAGKTHLIIGVVAGGIAVIILVGVLFWRWRRRRNTTAGSRSMYRSLPNHDEDDDDDLLDGGSDHETNDENGRRLSLISAASDDNLLRNEAPC